jgi:hypothetical protein
MIYLVLLTLTDIVLAMNQWESLVSSFWTQVLSEGRSDLEYKPVVSSAKSIVSKPVALGRSLTKQRNRMGPKHVH